MKKTKKNALKLNRETVRTLRSLDLVCGGFVVAGSGDDTMGACESCHTCPLTACAQDGCG
jgi:hypothetical protein